MITWQGFLLGVMIALTPSVALLAVLLAMPWGARADEQDAP
jgi:hypothetical protein